MSDVLFIKTSSLGDVIHHMPAVTEARRARPDLRFAWMVEEAFAPLVRLHPAVEKVVPVAWRRWRKSLYAPATISEIARNMRAIRSMQYELVVDTQGLLRTGILSRVARGVRHGYDSHSIRESPASVFYDVRHAVSRELHAVERNRVLSGLALDYAPRGAPDFGLDRARFHGDRAPYAVLLHASPQSARQIYWAPYGRHRGVADLRGEKAFCDDAEKEKIDGDDNDQRRQIENDITVHGQPPALLRAS